MGDSTTGHGDRWSHDRTVPTGVRGFWVVPSTGCRRIGRAYFAVQAVLGALWWIGVAVAPEVRRATLGALDPRWVAAFDIPLFVLASALAASGLRWPRHVAVTWTALVAMLMVGYATLTGLAGWGALLMVAAAIGSLFAAMLIVYGRVPAERLLRGPLAFRVAPARDPAGQLARTLIQLAGFWVLFLAVIPAVLVLVEARWGVGLDLGVWLRISGVPVLLLASALGLWSARVMAHLGDGTPLPSASANRLVVAGPYRLVRNPMAVAGIVQAIGVGLLANSWLTLLYAACGIAYWHALVRPFEEADLEARFGERFRAYRSRVRTWFPIPRSSRPAAGSRPDQSS